MWTNPKFIVADTSIVPEVFLKVLYAKNLMETGQAPNITAATKQANISRSVYYKYKDCIFSYSNEMSGKVVSIYTVMRDKPGMLSNAINILHKCGCNILTINQNIPVDGMAAVSFSFTMDSSISSDMDVFTALRAVDGITEVRKLSSN